MSINLAGPFAKLAHAARHARPGLWRAAATGVVKLRRPRRAAAPIKA